LEIGSLAYADFPLKQNNGLLPSGACRTAPGVYFAKGTMLVRTCHQLSWIVSPLATVAVQRVCG
jgi:hypothetical protein